MTDETITHAFLWFCVVLWSTSLLAGPMWIPRVLEELFDALDMKIQSPFWNEVMGLYIGIGSILIYSSIGVVLWFLVLRSYLVT